MSVTHLNFKTQAQPMPRFDRGDFWPYSRFAPKLYQKQYVLEIVQSLKPHKFFVDIS